MGKWTKTEYFLLLLTALFLIFLFGLFRLRPAARAQSGYTVTTERETDWVLEKETIHINTAPAAELEQLNGVGPVLAQRIVDYRQEHGPFQEIEELLEVEGIGPATLEKFRHQVTIGEEP